MRNELHWGAYIARNEHGLYVTDSVPVCETCHGVGQLTYTVSDTGKVYGELRPCYACDGTGHAWHIEITPANWDNGLIEFVNDGTWECGPPYSELEKLYVNGLDELYVKLRCAYKPLAPPPGVCTLAEALAMLPCCVEYGGVLHIDLGGGFAAQCRNGKLNLFHTDGAGQQIDPDAAEQALQRYKALAQYAAQEGWR
jgi:hypothetical protein